MSTYVYMKVLESAPQRYDRGLRLLSLGRIDAVYAAVAAAAVAGLAAPRVLEVGCGTGNLTRALVARGARVTAVDFNPDMLALARAKLVAAAERVEFHEMAAVEIADRFAPESFDAAAATLVLSEMSADEQAFVLRATRTVLRPGGRLVVADEVRPAGWAARGARALLRWPLAVLTYVLTQTSTAALRDLPGLVTAAGFRVVASSRLPGGVGLVVAERPRE
jgi:ubiquinone/menaquinone biosynthesis C-methylase UbiE